MGDMLNEVAIKIPAMTRSVRNALVVTTLFAVGIVLVNDLTWKESFGTLFICFGVGAGIGMFIHAMAHIDD